MPDNTSLLDACMDSQSKFYGYDCVSICARKKKDGNIELIYKERDTFPTAEEIESRYDIERHPNELMRRELEGE